MKSLLIATAMFMSTSVLASSAIRLLPQANKLHFIQSIGDVAPAMNIEAYERELDYIHSGLTLEEKVQNEAVRLVEVIRLQVIKAYEAELENTGNSLEAYEIVKNKIYKDLELADSGMKDDLLSIAEHALQNLTEAPRSEEIDLTNLRNILREDIKKREAYFLALDFNPNLTSFDAKISKSTAPKFQNFASRAEVVKSLVSENDNARWFRTSNAVLKSAVATSKAASVSLQVKIEFLGVGVEAGPRISFSRDYSTSVTILADGLAPALDHEGNFDHYEKDRRGRSTNKRRFIGFFCDATLSFRSNYEGKGAFRVAGIGADSSVSKEFSNHVALNSRRIFVPEMIGNKKVNLRMLSEICHNDFLNGKINAKVSVKDSLDLMMKNVISGIRFSHPETQCVLDSHCAKWFNTEVLSILRNKATARCLGNAAEGKFSCVLRGTRGQNCAVIENGKRTSSGLGEYICDKGLRCVKTRNAGWLQGGRLYQPSAGQCR
ncbi:MAG: hypothetical protein WDA09_04075 [Bacteriovoracaceae bacterium]